MLVVMPIIINVNAVKKHNYKLLYDKGCRGATPFL